MDLETLFKQPNILPSTPKILQELINSLKNDNVSVEEISNKLSADPVLSIKVLRLANSAYYRQSRSIKTIDGAISLLGFSTVRTLVITNSLVHGFKDTNNFNLKQFWRYSLHTAVIGKWLSRHTGEDPELAFTLGMIHGVGQLIIHSGMPKEAKLLDDKCSPFHEFRLGSETALLGFNHFDVSAELVREWKFPETMFSVLNNLAKPLKGDIFIPMSVIIHIAIVYARAIEEGKEEIEIVENIPIPLLVSLGLKHNVFSSMGPLSEMLEGLEELIS